MLTRRALIVGGVSLAAGCALSEKPPLEELYRQTAASAVQPPLIVIPGAFGSVLRETATGREIWPGSSADLLLSRYRRLEVDFDEDSLEPLPDRVEAQGVFTDGLGQDFYGALLRTLERIAGFRRRAPGTPPDEWGRNYYVFVYDWRLDNSASASGLHALIESIRSDYADPALQVDIIGYSNGGLLARYYARFGATRLDGESQQATHAGAASIRRLLLLGTPNLGTLQPILALARGEEMPLRSIAPEIVATWSGAPQLMPHPGVPWLADVGGRLVKRDAFDIETWRELRWCIFDSAARERVVAQHGGGAAGRRYLERLERYFAKHLERAKRFASLIAAPAEDADVRPFVFGGDCAQTLARLVVERIGERFFPREQPDAIAGPKPGVDYRSLMFEPGDAVVTRSSLLGQAAPGEAPSIRIAHSVFLCERHRNLTGNPSFQDNLLHALFSGGQ